MKIILYLSIIIIVGGFTLFIIASKFTQKTILPIFYTNSPDLTETKGDFSLSDYYITNKVTGLNKYYIDDESNLWGYGTNEYGQLGNGTTSDLSGFTNTPIKIASDVISVDCSINGYFCIYLTADGKLYGMGANLFGLLDQGIEECKDREPKPLFSCERVMRPVLLMEEVVYARAGRESIVVLKKDNSVWWWGQYMSTYRTNVSTEKYSSIAAEDKSNPRKMLKTSPYRMLENCAYVTTGDYTGAAISQNGDLYIWGLNIFGECGTRVTEDDYIRIPCKVLENVRMVWPETIELNSTLEEIPEYMSYETVYHFNTFAQLKDGTILAAGIGLGESEKTISITGDLEAETFHTYSDSFVPVKIKKFSKEEIQELISQLEIGTNRDDVEKYLSDNGIQFFYNLVYDEKTQQYIVDLNELRDQEQKYFFYFDSKNNLIKIAP